MSESEECASEMRCEESEGDGVMRGREGVSVRVKSVQVRCACGGVMG